MVSDMPNTGRVAGALGVPPRVAMLARRDAGAPVITPLGALRVQTGGSRRHWFSRLNGRRRG